MIHSLYIHFPYCRQVCHYCDFAKTANFTDSHLAAYLEALSRHLEAWVRRLASIGQPLGPLRTVYFGGGTPSILSAELRPFLEILAPFLSSDAEVTLEANPNDIDREKLQTWRELGIDRLSIGIQTLDAQGLRFLTRDHDRQGALRALSLALERFSKVSCDFIYGWPGQDAQSLAADFAAILKERPAHVSAYSLTFAPSTPIGRAWTRGKIQGLDDDKVADFYELVCEFLRGETYEHYEVSNWSLNAGLRSRHNQVYWRDGYYLGIGPGAHGYLPEPGKEFGLRYAYAKDDRRFLRSDSFCDAAIEWERGRDRLSWLHEQITTGLRTLEGLDLQSIEARAGFRFSPDTIIEAAMSEGWLQVDAKRLRLAESQWFREESWAVKVAGCFTLG